MKTIMVATDLSTRSSFALARALQIAEATGSEMLLISVVDEDQPDDIIQAISERVGAHLRASAEQFKTSVPIRFEVLAGDVYWTIHEAAERAQAWLLVVGDHRRNAVRDVFRDTTVERLVRLTRIPVLLCRTEPRHRYESAIVGIESREAEDLVAVIDALGSAGPRRLVGLHVFDAVAAGFLSSLSVPTDRIDAYKNEVAAEAKRNVANSIPAALRERLPIRVREGSPAVELQSVAATERCDLVIVSSHARRGILRTLLGSVSSELIRHGASDLIIVPRAVSAAPAGLAAPQ